LALPLARLSSRWCASEALRQSVPIAQNALSSDQASEWSRNTVNEWGLLDRFDDQPEVALAELREIVTKGSGGKTELFALAEFSLLHAQDTGKRPYHLAAAVYAYAFLFRGLRCSGTNNRVSAYHDALSKFIY
jgi:hypothetical protein